MRFPFVTSMDGRLHNARVPRYTREDIFWDPTVFPDNTPTMELLEKRPLGLLPLLDSECKRGAAALDDAALVSRGVREDFSRGTVSHLLEKERKKR